ncbi:unnamed protein product [Citrullus colocynthis]|uniref:Uncharacterized protein n=1 Tax=Citrullus colocynthis TaxID=252529 RepID=A0ABP0XUL0_9ROSI
MASSTRWRISKPKGQEGRGATAKRESWSVIKDQGSRSQLPHHRCWLNQPEQKYCFLVSTTSELHQSSNPERDWTKRSEEQASRKKKKGDWLEFW